MEPLQYQFTTEENFALMGSGILERMNDLQIMRIRQFCSFVPANLIRWIDGEE